MDFGKKNGSMLAPKINEKSMSLARSDFLFKCGFSSARIKNLRVKASKIAFKNKAKSIKNQVKMGGRVGIDFSSSLVSLESQVGTPNRARRGLKHDLTGEGRPQQGKRPRQVSHVKSSKGRRIIRGVERDWEGFTLP